ncbi:MAG: carboxypeptidase-like regulatory domain-containing protein, partial [Bacteroidia bacterium]|nr:carboxypeptidase-like regulatory domain-containing protein [Bacteroidia bacterium]
MKRIVRPFRVLFTALIILAFTTISSAQTSISGKIVDSENSEPLVGAYIITVGAPGGAITDTAG